MESAERSVPVPFDTRNVSRVTCFYTLFSTAAPVMHTTTLLSNLFPFPKKN